MKTIIRNISLLLCAVAALISCYRKPIDDKCLCENTLSIPIDIDWTKSGIALQNVSVLFYDSKTGELAKEHTYEHNDKEIQSYASLPIGDYKAVIFNELRNQIDYVSCVGHQNFETLKFESNNDTPMRSRTETTRGYVEQPGDLAVAVVEDIVITKEMIVEAAQTKAAQKAGDTKSLSDATRATVESLMGVVTQKRSNTIKITAHILGINNARMPSLVDLSNLSDGYFVSGDRNSSTPSTLQFTMNNRTFDEGSNRNGTISTTVTSFGTLGDRESIEEHDDSTPITLDLLFKLVDEDQTEEGLKADVTNLMKISEESDGSIVMTIDVDFDTPLSDVVPEDSDGGSGFGSTVEDWGDIVTVPLQ